MGNPLAGVLLKPSLRLGDGLAFLFALWFVVDRGVGNGEGDGIEHGFEQADDGTHLAGSQALDQFRPTTARTWRGARRSISSWACSLVPAIGIPAFIFHTARRELSIDFGKRGPEGRRYESVAKKQNGRPGLKRDARSVFL